MRIANWDKFQAKRADRDSTPWIKLYRRTLLSPTWHQMVDQERGQFMAMLLLAESDGTITTDDPTVLQRMGGMTEAPDLQRFIDLGLLEGASLATKRLPLGPPEKEKEKEVEVEKELTKNTPSKPKSVYDDDFLQWWAIYPRKVGKGNAWAAWAKAKKIATLDALFAGARFLREQVDAGRDLQYVKHPSTWLNSHGWEDEEDRSPANEWKDILDGARRIDEASGGAGGDAPNAEFPKLTSRQEYEDGTAITTNYDIVRN